MDLIRDHIQHYLFSFINEKSSTFVSNLNDIKSDPPTEFINIVNYLDKIYNETFLSSSNSLCALHIHFENEFSESQKIFIAEFLLIKYFRHYQSNENISNQPDLELKQLISTFEAKQIGLEMRCPDGASGKNGGNRVWKNWLQDKKNNSSLLDFYKKINETSALKFKSIFNSQKNFSHSISNLFEFRPIIVELGNKNKSYNLLNSTQTLNTIDGVNNEIIDELDSVVLFDCERKSIMINYTYEEINKWNSEYSTNFRKYLILTFGKGVHSINTIRNKLESIRERFKIPTNSSYIVLPSEIDLLLNKKEKSSVSIEFVGFESSIFWDTFLFETSKRELYELRSIKMMNIYSICFNYDIKSYIIDELFSNKESSELISSSTKMAILESSENDIQILKEALSNILDLIVNSEIKSKITEKLRYEPTIILDDAIIKNSKLVNNLSNALGFINSIKLNSWTDLTNDVLGKFLILSYRDQGKFPNYFYPNLIEYNYEGQNRGKAILINFLFGNHYRWSKYFILKEYQKYLTNTIRENNFGWNELKKSIQLQKPESKLYIDWNLENEFSNSDSRETFKVKTINQRAKTYHSSDFIIYSERNLQKPRIERMKWVFENLDFEDTKYDIQKLDELLSDFNPAESLIDTTQQELDLQIIRDQLGLENESAGRIWKTLLRKKSELLGIESLYEELKTIFNKYSIPLVSINYFRSSWINVESDTLIPRGNKVFKVLCDYLNLNNNYRLIIFRLKNASISGKIEATKKYSSLLKDLFADGCFDGNSSKQTILQSKMHHYKNNHALDEIGIDIDNPMNGLVSLIELIQPELKLSELEIIEKN